MNRIIVNEESIDVQGNNIVITKDGKVIIGDNVVKTGLTGELKVRFEGDVANIGYTNLIVEGNVMGDVDCTRSNCTW